MNSKVYTKTPFALDRMIKDVQQSSITKAIDISATNIFGDQVTVIFKEDLPDEQWATMDAIVAANDGTPLEDTYVQNVSIEEPKDLDGRAIKHSTPRRLGTYTYFTGSGDDQTSGLKTGFDLLTDTIPEEMIMRFDMAGKSSDSKYIDLNVLMNETFVCEGYCMFKDADNDLLEFKLVPRVTNYSVESGTNFYLWGGFLILPAAGTGNIAVSPSDMLLVESTVNEFGVRSAGYWDCDVDAVTGLPDLETLAPNAGGFGRFNMFAVELSLFRFGNCMPLLGSGSIHTGTYDSSQIGSGMRIKVSAKANGDPHAWKFNLILTMHRKKTV